MKNITMNTNEIRTINGGKTYRCPFGCNNRGGFWSVYWHCLSSQCFLRDPYYRTLYNMAGGCLNLAGILSGLIK